jgi:hypothetical protein
MTGKADLIFDIENQNFYPDLEMYFAAVAALMNEYSKFVIADFILYAWQPRFEKQLEKWFKIVKKDDVTKNVLESLRLDSSTDKLLKATFPQPLSLMMRHLWGLDGTPMNNLIQKGWFTYQIYTLILK